MTTLPQHRAEEGDVDAMVHEMRRANRRPLLIGLGVVVALALLGGLYVANGKSSAASELARRGYTATVITMNGPFSYGFTGVKGTAKCGGSYERMPFSSSLTETCFDASLAAPEVVRRPDHELLEQELRTQLSSLSITAARCAAVEPGATKARCTVEAATGTPVEVVFARSGGEWSQERPDRMMARAKLAETLAKDFHAKGNAAITVDCGAGLLGYGEGDTLTCTAAPVKGAKKPGSIVVTFGAGAGYTWKATGI